MHVLLTEGYHRGTREGVMPLSEGPKQMWFKRAMIVGNCWPSNKLTSPPFKCIKSVFQKTSLRYR